MDIVFKKLANKKLSKGERRKLEIIQAAISLVAEEGIEYLTYESVGKRSGLKRAHVAYYFKKKEDIIMTVIQFIALNARELVDEHLKLCSDKKLLIEYYIDAHRLWIDRFPQHGVIYLLFYYYSSYYESYQQLNKSIRELGQARVASLLYDSGICKDTNHAKANLLAHALQQMLLASLIDSITLEKTVTPTEFNILKKRFYILANSKKLSE